MERERHRFIDDDLLFNLRGGLSRRTWIFPVVGNVFQIIFLCRWPFPSATWLFSYLAIWAIIHYDYRMARWCSYYCYMSSRKTQGEGERRGTKRAFSLSRFPRRFVFSFSPVASLEKFKSETSRIFRRRSQRIAPTPCPKNCLTRSQDLVRVHSISNKSLCFLRDQEQDVLTFQE